MTRKAIAASCSIGPKNAKTGSRLIAYKHDLRTAETFFYPDHIDAERTVNNVILVDKLNAANDYEKALKAYTDEKYQPYVDEYDARQKKPCRRIGKSYTAHLMKQKQPPELSWQIVVQIGSHMDLGGLYYKDNDPYIHDVYVTCYKRALQEIKEKFPHLDVLCATVHFDEPNGSPHMHVIFQPDGQGFKTGMKHQVSLASALTADGIGRSASRDHQQFQLSRFAATVRQEILNPMIEQMGFEVKAERHGIAHHTPVSEFTERQETLQQKEQQLMELQGRLKAAKEAFDNRKNAMGVDFDLYTDAQKWRELPPEMRAEAEAEQRRQRLMRKQEERAK